MGKPVKISDRKKTWYRRRGGPQRASAGRRPLRRRVLIVCEGEKTEPHYFQAIADTLPRHVAEIRIEGIGANTLGLVKTAKELRLAGSKTSLPFDDVWIVFDRDSFPADNFDNAIHQAEANGIQRRRTREFFGLIPSTPAACR